jgi:L-threonine-O-3-phosphate decarboxylase
MLTRPDLAALPAVPHGSVSQRELEQYGLTPQDVIDFSVNTNPLGPAPTVLQAIADTDWSRYPGDDERRLREALGEHVGVAPERIVLGNGSAELIWLIALATLRAGDLAVVIGPTFGEYARSSRIMGATVVEVADKPLPKTARLVWLCNPNNPTGRLWSAEALAPLFEAEALVCVDQAYAAFGDKQAEMPEHDNVVALRSMTKDHALPGLRLGYAVASLETARALEAVRPPWSVNAGALRAGLAALQPAAQKHLHSAHQVVRLSRAALEQGLRGLGYTVWQSAANFLLVEVGDGAAFRRALLPRGMVVRDCASFGLPRCVRIACRTPAETHRLLEAVEEIAQRV